ncbi:Hypothetical predicted protein [Marmota monax]|uniref:Uncharacterized protein n=1 Tax=Marmota monax TaxID=9995 RepID=A0A5E4A414_MARMO|nr:Hypothetical predicted protein [Marmota monax]
MEKEDYKTTAKWEDGGAFNRQGAPDGLADKQRGASLGDLGREERNKTKSKQNLVQKGKLQLDHQVGGSPQSRLSSALPRPRPRPVSSMPRPDPASPDRRGASAAGLGPRGACAFFKES